jgi:exodeoxyribonuclease-1
MKNIAIIDIESQGASTSYSSIISIAGILVNPDLKEIERFELNCRNKPGHVPDPYSLWINKGFYQMKKSNSSHYQLMKELHKIIKKWSPSIWIGWNSIGFDFIMLQKENYKSLFPAYVLNTNSNEQADFLPVARSSKLFFPKSINTTFSEKNNPVFKLENLSVINDIKVDQFHTAISDCEACLGIMRIIRKNAKQIYDQSFNTTSKHKVFNILEKERIFTTTFYYYGKARSFLVTYLCNHGEYNWPIVFCLEQDPENFLKLDVNSLKEELKKPGKWARALPANKHPIILDKNLGLELDIYSNIGLKKLKERADKIFHNKQFSEKVSFALGEIAREKKSTKEEKALSFEDRLVVGGFASEKDHILMEEFQDNDDWKKKNDIIKKLEDQRFKYFGKRLIYQNQPEVLSRDEYKKIHQDIAKKILSIEESNFTTIPMAENLIDNMRNEKKITKEKLEYVNDIDVYISEIRKVYEKAI